MSYPFRARIFKAGINPCVKVPGSITRHLLAENGYIPVKGMIAGFPFQQTLCPVKNEEYRLYVNGMMLKESKAKVGQLVNFTLEQDNWDRVRKVPMHKALKKKLKETGLLDVFYQLAASRQKEVNRYINNLKTEAALEKNIDKLIKSLAKKPASPHAQKK